MSRVQYETEWGKEYRKPGLIARLLGLLMRWIPKVWFLKALTFKLPSPQTEDLYIKSVNATVHHSRELLRQIGTGDLQFPNTDCDTGRQTLPGEYQLSDETHARLLDRLVRHGNELPEELRASLLSSYSVATPPKTCKGRKAWQRITNELRVIELGPHSADGKALRQQLLAPPFMLQSPKAKDQIGAARNF